MRFSSKKDAEILEKAVKELEEFRRLSDERFLDSETRIVTFDVPSDLAELIFAQSSHARP